ncbi:MAG: hypothetical protein JWM56_1405 [Candidatus Peribacteria bacterium]|nr:hypothetical protein [Candidatus Peribacteria bacterium]
MKNIQQRFYLNAALLFAGVAIGMAVLKYLSKFHGFSMSGVLYNCAPCPEGATVCTLDCRFVLDWLMVIALIVSILLYFLVGNLLYSWFQRRL